MTTTTTISANSQYLHQRRQQQQPLRMNDDNNDNEQQQQLEIYHASIALSSDFHPLNLKTVIPGYENLYQLTCRLFTFISVKLIEWNGVTKKFVYFLKNLNFHLAKIIGSILDVTSHNDLHSQSHLKVLNPVPQKLYEIFKSTLNDCERFYLSISHRKIEGISRESQESLIKNRRRDFREIFMNIYSVSAACGLVSLEEEQLMKEKICNLEWLDTQSPFNLDDPLPPPPPPPKHQATSTANPATIVPSSTETSSSSASLSGTDRHRHHSSAIEKEKSVVLDEKREILTKMDAHPKLLVPPPPPLSPPPPLPSSPPPPPSILSSSSLSDPDPVSFSVKQLLDRDRDESTHDWDGEKIFFDGDHHQNSIIIDAGSNFHDRSSVDIAVDITSNENHTNSFGKESSSSSLMMIANEESHLSDNNRSDIYNETDHKEIVVGGYTPFRSLHSQEQKQQRLNPHKWNRKVSQQYRGKLTPFVRSTSFTEEVVHFLHPHSRGDDEKRQQQRYYQQHHSWEIAHSDQSRSSRDLHFPPTLRHNFNNNNEKNYYHTPY